MPHAPAPGTVLGVLAAVADGQALLQELPPPSGAAGPGFRYLLLRSGRAMPAEGATVASSRAHGDGALLENWLKGKRVAGRHSAGSSLKFGLLAEGRADIYPRFGRTMEWDTAAGHAVLAAAGGSVCDVAGQPLLYGKPGFENPHFIARGLPPSVPAQTG